LPLLGTDVLLYAFVKRTRINQKIISTQSLKFLKRFLCVGLWARRFRHRHLHLLGQRDGGRRNKDD
ncbi:MAG TPA: hypothetical protein VLQ90_13265, partial [Pyrinomonadaceae bacterium]|nr:hypothetical protein [Pyrinomonadaceae bacterium]